MNQALRFKHRREEVAHRSTRVHTCAHSCRAPVVELVTTACRIYVDLLRKFKRVLFTAYATTAGFCAACTHTTQMISHLHL
eukprot:SAG11_NODE_2345_length_3487_cov_1.677981_3_plen_81_part_00